MKHMNAKQIEAVKGLTYYSPTNFHGNRKTYNGINVEDVRMIVQKKVNRMRAKQEGTTSVYKSVRENIEFHKKSKGTPYFKIMIEGTNNIYLASLIYGHRDYNKSRMFANDERGRKLMNLYNSIVNKPI